MILRTISQRAKDLQPWPQHLPRGLSLDACFLLLQDQGMSGP